MNVLIYRVGEPTPVVALVMREEGCSVEETMANVALKDTSGVKEAAAVFRTFRESLGISMGHAADIFGCSVVTVSDLERGRLAPMPEDWDVIKAHLAAGAEKIPKCARCEKRRVAYRGAIYCGAACAAEDGA